MQVSATAHKEDDRMELMDVIFKGARLPFQLIAPQKPVFVVTIA